MDWEKWGLFVSLVTPLVLGVGAWINDALSKRKKRGKSPQADPVITGMPVDYETDYVNLLKRNLAESNRRNIELEKEIKKLRSRTHGNSDNR